MHSEVHIQGKNFEKRVLKFKTRGKTEIWGGEESWGVGRENFVYFGFEPGCHCGYLNYSLDRNIFVSIWNTKAQHQCFKNRTEHRTGEGIRSLVEPHD
jgi:hypothetical protein